MRICVLFGGESVEHEISVITANQIMNALSVNYTVIPVYISKDNKFYYTKNLFDIECYKNIKKITKKENEITIERKEKKCFIKRKFWKCKKYFDMAFVAVHGRGMEDSTLLSYLKLKHIPVIADNLSFYAIAQNKTFTKRILNDLNICNTDFVELSKGENIPSVKYPVIVKPNTLGSSIGINVANNKKEFDSALEEAFKYDKKAIVEEYLQNSKEYNISVVERKGKIITSDIEEIIKDGSIFSYADKYENGDKNKLNIMRASTRVFPFKSDKELKKQIEETAIKIYKYFEAKGVIRIDFLYKDKLYVNEINSIPGSYAYYLWRNKMDFVELLDTVIDSSKRDIYTDNKLIKCVDKMTIFNKLGEKMKTPKICS